MLIWLGKNILNQQESPVSEDSSQVLPWNVETVEEVTQHEEE